MQIFVPYIDLKLVRIKTITGKIAAVMRLGVRWFMVGMLSLLICFMPADFIGTFV